MKARLRTYSLTFSVIWAGLSVASSQTISGFVQEKATGEPLSFVNVFIEDSYLSVEILRNSLKFIRTLFLDNSLGTK